jgi:hypothetical protein
MGCPAFFVGPVANLRPIANRPSRLAGEDLRAGLHGVEYLNRCLSPARLHRFCISSDPVIGQLGIAYPK